LTVGEVLGERVGSWRGDDVGLPWFGLGLGDRLCARLGSRLGLGPSVPVGANVSPTNVGCPSVFSVGTDVGTVVGVPLGGA